MYEIPKNEKTKEREEKKNNMETKCKDGKRYNFILLASLDPPHKVLGFD